MKGQPNLTVGTFFQWVNDDLLPNETLDYVPDFFLFYFTAILSVILKSLC